MRVAGGFRGDCTRQEGDARLRAVRFEDVIVGGGFSANSQLRAKLLEVGAEHGVEVRVPQLKLCTDNGAMVAMLGVNLVEAGVAPSNPDFAIDSAMPLTKISM